MMVKAHENCAFLRYSFWSFGYFVGKRKTRERMGQLIVNHCINLKMSYEFDENFDVIVVGAGHAGVEAS